MKLFMRPYGTEWDHIEPYSPDVGKLVAQRARFGKTVEAAGRTLIEKRGEHLFMFFSFFFRDHSSRANVISKMRFSLRFLVFHFSFGPMRLIFLKIIAIRHL